MPDAAVSATGRTYAGLFLVTLATLMYEVLLTRIFSVTMWYHYAFMAISVALFGMTVGAILVYLLPARFPRAGAKRQLAWSALLFAAAVVASFAVHVAIPMHGGPFALTGLLIPTYIVTSVPFTLGGICVSLALTRFPRQVSTLYAADLAGAAAGCLLLIGVLDATDGPTAVIVTAALAALGAAVFAAETGSTGLWRATLASTVLLALFAGANGILATHQSAPLRLTWVKGGRDLPAFYEKWNSFSRVTVTGSPPGVQGWGLSTALPPGLKIHQLAMWIDSSAFTIITAFDGNLGRLGYLKYDVTNIAHYIRRDAKVLVVGAGGGRDILSALVFGQKSVVALELNKSILDALNRRFGKLSGHLDRNPRVTLVNDEARSYIARDRTRYDIIQLSLVDTAAATAAGAYVLAENSLYTVEAWTLFLERLNPGGVLTVTRWFVGKRPGEMYRVTALAAAALHRLGVEHPRDHLVIVKAVAPFRLGGIPFAAATILVGKAPFSERDLATLADVARRMRFDLVLAPRTAGDATFAALASGRNPDQVAGPLHANLAPPTDDSPFFFNLLRLRDAFHRERVQGIDYTNADAVLILGSLLLLVIALTLACIVGPLLLMARQTAPAGILPLLVYFASIGVGFMMVEISQMQRLTVFLGHPTYGLSVVLSALLVSSGAGSLSTRRLASAGSTRPTVIRLSLLVAALCAFGVLTPWALGVCGGAPTPERIAVAVLLLLPIGLFMGMAFPLGMKAAHAQDGSATPWLWGINGATSVCASVLAVAVAMSAGISASYWTGVVCYAIASGALPVASRLASAGAGRGTTGTAGRARTTLAAGAAAGAAHGPIA